MAAVKRPRIAYYKENLPTPLCVFFSFFFALAFQFNGGVFLPTALQMSSELGYIKEDVSMAGYASFIGMTIIFPILFRLKFRFTTRSILLTVCPILIVCNLITILRLVRQSGNPCLRGNCRDMFINEFQPYADT